MKYVNNFNKHNNINEANDNTDQFYADIADNVYDRICEMLQHGDYKKKGEYFYINGLDIDESYKNLVFIFLHESHPFINKQPHGNFKISYAMGSMGSKKVIICSNLIRPADDTYIDSRLNRQSFVHEFIHYLDFARYKGSTNGSSQATTLEDYYNNPAEFNAHFQECANVVRRMITNQEFIMKKFAKDFDTFLPFFIRMLDKNFVKHLNRKYDIKLKKRVYNLYKGLMSKYIE